MTDTGYLLSYVRYGDNDAILHCFTKEAGFQSLFMRGIYSPKNKKKAYLAPLNELTFVKSDFRKASKIQNISKIEQIKMLDCHTDMRASAVIFFIAEFLHQVLANEMKQSHIYRAVDEFLNQIEKQNYQAHFIFLVEFLKIQGVAPLFGNGKFLDPENGCFDLEICHNLFNEEVSALWKDLISEEEIYNIKIKNTLKEDFLDSVLLYYYHHFPNFRVPKSLEVLRQVFSN